MNSVDDPDRPLMREQTPMEVSEEGDGYRMRWEADASYDPDAVVDRLKDQDFGSLDVVAGDDGFRYLRHESGEVEAYLEQDGVEFVYHGDDEPNKYVQIGIAALLAGDNVGFDVSTWLEHEDEDLPYDLLDPDDFENTAYSPMDRGIVK